jgi:hypothetical protein
MHYLQPYKYSIVDQSSTNSSPLSNLSIIDQPIRSHRFTKMPGAASSSKDGACKPCAPAAVPQNVPVRKPLKLQDASHSNAIFLTTYGCQYFLTNVALLYSIGI